MPVDLHIHSTYSDGSLTPVEIVAQAKDKDLAAIAITDHDSVDGIDQAKQALDGSGPTVLAGLELSTENDTAEVHVLGYNLDYHNSQLLELLSGLRQSRWNRALEILEKLKKLNKHLTVEDISPPDDKASVGRLHIAMALVKKGLVTDLEEAFRLYLNLGQPAYVPHKKFTPVEGLEVIRQFGGLSFLAHPGVSRCDHVIPEMIRAGLAGIEVFYPRHTAEQVSHYSQICRKNGLLMSGGSDFHGPGSNLYPLEIGRMTLSDKHWKAILNTIGSLN